MTQNPIQTTLIAMREHHAGDIDDNEFAARVAQSLEQFIEFESPHKVYVFKTDVGDMAISVSPLSQNEKISN